MAECPLSHEDCAVLAYQLGFARHYLGMELAGLEKLERMLAGSRTQERRLNQTREAIAKARADIDRCDRFIPKLTALQAWLKANGGAA